MASTWPRCFSVGSNRGRPVAAIVSLSKNYTRLHAGPSPSRTRESLAQQYTTINDVNTCGNQPWRAPRPCSSWGPVAHVLTPITFAYHQVRRSILRCRRAWKRSHGRTNRAPPDERGGKQTCPAYRHV